MLEAQPEPWFDFYIHSADDVGDLKGLVPWKAPHPMRVMGLSFDAALSSHLRCSAALSTTTGF